MIRAEVIDNDTHSSLQRYLINYGCKKFYETGPTQSRIYRRNKWLFKREKTIRHLDVQNITKILSSFNKVRDKQARVFVAH
jgi:hypothetical protein